MNNPLALIIDDEPDIRELLEITLGRMGIDTRATGDVAASKEILEKYRFDLCLTDMRLPDGNGIDLVEHINDHFPDLPVAVITAHGNMESAVQALKSGAFDFVSKPVDLKVLRKLVETALKLDIGQTTGKPTPSQDESSNILQGKSSAIKHIRKMIAKLARSQAPVYISGESGTGKELAARLIHDQGPRAEKPFVPVNCGAIPHELMESEFFGHKKGSFTGAVNDKLGLFQAADGGTLFLDEVADLPLHMQVKLLRAIQEKGVRPVGAQREVFVDARIISATHSNLSELVKKGEFRQDLFYRINVIELNIPPLRDRWEDIAILCDSILTRLSEQIDIEKPEIEEKAMQQLLNYHFPGNVRELENMLECALTLCDSNIIESMDLQIPNNPQQDTALPPNLSLEEHIEEVERALIIKALEETHWNRTAAAKKLGISFRALRYRLSKLDLDPK
ncbi:sigma-54-dependent transcriptional regulator [Solemya velesiana gill symbiont]|uniref:Sigma-54-dependent Fis family transcriptional regulator n=1 Tax=Solemya velesiana gill symbiont TaxID=1918948 RepID=A0A1T2KVV3_9GAMM|nr:sigma-54 dependent transcriptional regulator [Solemya velesiana gill symbiont]OOZ36942.1 sigma-54-dependent Fis family transcriptional regulator [Solemya velesiana gill symbiont]